MVRLNIASFQSSAVCWRTSHEQAETSSEDSTVSVLPIKSGRTEHSMGTFGMGRVFKV
jgi:hypothetical protein